MKYLQVVAATSPIESWLHSQLEARGVDRVYSRYILSLFQSTDVDQDFLDLDIPSKELKRLTKKNSHRSSHHRALVSSRPQARGLDPHKLIRASVIETLRSVSETKAGIETLVDELCDRLHSDEKSTGFYSNEKLSGFHSNEKLSGFHSNETYSSDAAPLSTAQSLTNVSVGVVDLAQKYYDAFPALGSNPRQSSAALLLACCTARPSPWNGKHKNLLSSALPGGILGNCGTENRADLGTSGTEKPFATESPVTSVENRRSSVTESLRSSATENLGTSATSSGDQEDKENHQNNQTVKSEGVDEVLSGEEAKSEEVSSGEEVAGNKMDRSMSVKRKLFVEVEEPKDSLASLMEKVDGTKDLWEATRWGGDMEPLSSCSTSSSLLAPFPPLAPLSGSSVSSGYPGASGFIPCGTNLTTSIWSEVEWGGGGKWSGGGDDSGVCMASPPSPPLDEEMARGMREQSPGVDSVPPTLLKVLSATLHLKAVLNHCPETSAFKPVVPGLNPLAGKVPAGYLAQPPPPAATEENLLTSARTHFCPIDKAPHYKSVTSEAVQYANGTTFSIASTMDEVDYRVGQDGTLTWDSAVYMEFKANGLTTECYNLCDPFKPKFRVLARGDKAVQTEARGAGQHEVACGDTMEDFYFPGEESIARDIMRSLEESDPPLPVTPPPSEPDLSDGEPPRCKKPCSPLLLDAWAVAWPPFSIWSTTRAGDGWPTPSHDYQELSKPGLDTNEDSWDNAPNATAPAAPATGLYTNYSIWAPPLPLDTNSNIILCTKCETPLPLGVNMGNLKISSDRKRRHSSSQYLGALSTFPCIKSEVSFFQQSITL